MLYDVDLLWFVIFLLSIATILWGVLFLQLRSKFHHVRNNQLSEIASVQHELQDQRAAQSSQLMHVERLSQACIKQLDKEPLLKRVLDTLWSVLSEEQPRVALTLWTLNQDTDTVVFEASSGCEKALFTQDEFHPTAYPFAQLFKNRHWLKVENIFDPSGFMVRAVWSRLGLPAECYLIPLIIEDSIQGVLTISADGKLEKDIERSPKFYACLWNQVTAALGIAIQGESAILDRLTGVHNREYFMKRFLMEIDRSTRYQYPLTLLMIDVDNFKEVNDMLGHQRGDAVLKIISKFLKHGLRSSDLAARYGGDEFIILLPETGFSGDLPGGVVVADRLRHAVDEEFRGLQKPLNMTVSIGVAVRRFPQDKQMDARELIRLTDEQLLEAKMSGKNAVCYEGKIVRYVHEDEED